MTRTPPSLLRAAGWCGATALGAALLWPLAGLVAWLALGQSPDLRGVDVRGLALIGAFFGAAAGAVAAPLVLRPRRAAAVFWVPALAVASGVGSGAAGAAWDIDATGVRGLLSSSPGFGLGGALAGLAGFVWALRYPRPSLSAVAFDDSDELGQPAPAAATTIAPRGRIGLLSLVRLVPLMASAGCSMALAVRVGESDGASGVLIGVVGLSVVLTLCDHEERVRRLEREGEWRVVMR
ncbi:hypothetical protein [Gemmata sp.]|uniref:hypothetical protein n=1 Tax=Gemmata sp. TaxID=1914242 RepID=UPI003F6F4F0E